MGLIASGVEVVYSRGEPHEVKALDDVSLNIAEGEFVLIAGRSGSGKSTLLHCLSGLKKPAAGRISLDGMAAEKARKLIGLAVQFPERALFEKTLYDDIAFGPGNAGLRENVVSEKVLDAIKITGLDSSLLNSSPRSLSHGQKRLAAIAGVIALGPKYLFLDEPTAGLDADSRRRVLAALSSLNVTGTTIIAASHSLAHFSGISSRLVVLDGGKICFDGKPDGLVSLDNLEALGLALPPSLVFARKIRKLGIYVKWDAEPEEIAEMPGRANEGAV